MEHISKLYFSFLNLIKRSGRSYIMRGDENSDIGLVPRFARDLLGMVENTVYSVYISVIQVYKDLMFDLLREDQRIGVIYDSGIRKAYFV